jgi:hypothetical protein
MWRPFDCFSTDSLPVVVDGRLRGHDENEE